MLLRYWRHVGGVTAADEEAEAAASLARTKRHGGREKGATRKGQAGERDRQRPAGEGTPQQCSGGGGGIASQGSRRPPFRRTVSAFCWDRGGNGKLPRRRASCSSPLTGKDPAPPRGVIAAVDGDSLASPAAASPCERQHLPTEDAGGSSCPHLCQLCREGRTACGRVKAQWTVTRPQANRAAAARSGRGAVDGDATRPWQSRAPSHEGRGHRQPLSRREVTHETPNK